MKRGAIEISQELLTLLLTDVLPSDFKLSGIEFIPSCNTIKLHGYSEEFHETPENCVHLNESNGRWKTQPLQITINGRDIAAEDTTYNITPVPWWKFW